MFNLHPIINIIETTFHIRVHHCDALQVIEINSTGYWCETVDS